MLDMLFTPIPSHAPELTLLLRVLLLGVYVVLLYLAYRFKDSRWFRLFWWGLQFLQVASLYTWYAAAGLPLSESLPFYHCRLAMLTLLFGRSGKGTHYFAYMGLFGSLAAFIYPVFDAYPFPHVTILSFVLGHYALAVNCLLYLLREQEYELTGRELIGYTLVINAVIAGASLLTGGNYGFMLQLPILATTDLLVNYSLLSLVLIGVISLLQRLFQQLVYGHIPSKERNKSTN